jgi:hypothetical protein
MTSRADFSAVSRRRFLGYSLGAGSLLLMGGAGGLLALRGRAPAVDGLRCLTAHEYRTLAALADALFPAGGAFPLGAADTDVAHRLDLFLADEPAWNQRDLKRALVLLEYGPVLFDRRLVTFSHLDADQRAAHFATWTACDSATRRQAALAFRRLLALLFYDRPEAWSGVGYDGPYLARG